ncbi:Flagellar biosynthesis protein, FliO [Planctomycetes bacterium Pla163]|uniref:Flagellar biosynthesis protein, FliO n=1 Tax=Rohdeia mirabilis TaxID=2528008 RepID=A0A518D4R6_9BACT|nr:Flagellar biosynthesis protein, FliO [Planctomycetes bacterium Pla163]
MLDVAILHTVPVLAQVAGSPTPVSGGVDVTRYLLACLVVVVLMCAGAWLLMRLGRGATIGRAAKRSLKVVDVLPLGRKQKLCVVRAYDRTFVLGLGEREVTLVTELDTDDDLAAQALVDASGGAAKGERSFAALLRGALGGAPATQAVPAPVAAPVTAPVTAPVAAPAPQPVATAAAAVEQRVAIENDVERRAAAAAREALMAVLDERRAEVRAAVRPTRTERTATRRPVEQAAPANAAPRAASQEAPRSPRKSAAPNAATSNTGVSSTGAEPKRVRRRRPVVAEAAAAEPATEVAPRTAAAPSTAAGPARSSWVG